MQFNFDKEETILYAIQKLCFYMGFLYDNNSWASIFLVLKAVIMVLLSFLHFTLAVMNILKLSSIFAFYKIKTKLY